MALIKCERCGKMFSERINQCPHCGCTKLENLQLAFNKRREAEEARARTKEEARIQAERRVLWWKNNGNAVIIIAAAAIFAIIVLTN